MRQLAVLLCLSFAVLLFSAGEAWSLPKCPSNWTFNIWTNCFGTHTYADGTYIGEFRDDKANGQGTYNFGLGKKVGQYRYSTGQGTAIYTHGDKYVGEFRDDKFHGHGTATFASGGRYVGEFRNGSFNGQGTFTHAAGVVQEGVWEDGVFQYAAKDRLVYCQRLNGSIFEGWGSCGVLREVTKPGEKPIIYYYCKRGNGDVFRVTKKIVAVQGK